MDAQQLIEHLTDTPAFIERHRSRMLPGGIGYSDAPTFLGFRSQSPCSDHAMELGDMEAAFVGNIARHCMVLGSIPLHSLKGLWFIDGVCKGIRSTGVRPIKPLIRHLIDHAEDIINTEGVEPLLRAGQETRWYSKKMFPQETQKETQWVSMEEAESITGRSARTIRRWIDAKSVRALGKGKDAEILREDLHTMLKIAKENHIKVLEEARKNRWK